MISFSGNDTLPRYIFSRPLAVHVVILYLDLLLGTIMEIDEVFNKIGEFGRSQKKIFFLMNIANVLAAFHVLIFTFIAEEPVWVCAKSEDASQPIRTACEMIARGECVPDYLTDYYSIIEQVRVGENANGSITNGHGRAAPVKGCSFHFM